MTAEFPDLSYYRERKPPTELCAFDKDWNVKDWVKNFNLQHRRDRQHTAWLSFILPTTVGREWFDQRHCLDPEDCPDELKEEIARKLDFIHGRSPYIMNGVPISNTIKGCCVNDPCYCRSDVIFYNGKAYDQKPFLQARLRTRPGNVMYLEGKLIPPFNPGKSPQIIGPYRARDKYPTSMAFNDSQFGKGLSPCCTTSIYNDKVPPYHNTLNYAFSKRGLPYGETLGYFRFKPHKVCDCREIPVQKLGECCTCEPGEYNPAQYIQDECPGRLCCC